MLQPYVEESRNGDEDDQPLNHHEVTPLEKEDGKDTRLNLPEAMETKEHGQSKQHDDSKQKRRKGSSKKQRSRSRSKKKPSSSTRDEVSSPPLGSKTESPKKAKVDDPSPQKPNSKKHDVLKILHHEITSPLAETTPVKSNVSLKEMKPRDPTPKRSKPKSEPALLKDDNETRIDVPFNVSALAGSMAKPSRRRRSFTRSRRRDTSRSSSRGSSRESRHTVETELKPPSNRKERINRKHPSRQRPHSLKIDSSGRVVPGCVTPLKEWESDKNDGPAAQSERRKKRKKRKSSAERRDEQSANAEIGVSGSKNRARKSLRESNLENGKSQENLFQGHDGAFQFDVFDDPPEPKLVRRSRRKDWIHRSRKSASPDMINTVESPSQQDASVAKSEHSASFTDATGFVSTDPESLQITYAKHYESIRRREFHRRVFIFFSYVFVFVVGFILGAAIWNSRKRRERQLSEATLSPQTYPEGNVTVGAYYYPWYGSDFHRGEGYVRKLLSPPHEPVLGEYDDTDPSIIHQHLKWSAQGNINLWVTSWWGIDSREDRTIQNVILPHEALGDHKIAIFYETTGRIKKSENYSVKRVLPDIEYICQHYFDHPNYFRIDDRPVLFVYLTRLLERLDLLDVVIHRMRQAATKNGCGNIFIVGDHVFQNPPEIEDARPAFRLLDAVTNYDIYGSMFQPSPYATEPVLQRYFESAEEWKNIAAASNCAFIPSVSPGYNDLGVRPEKKNAPLSRKLSETEPSGSLFRRSLHYAKRLVDHGIGDLIMVNSFNEWHEDTQIEPARGAETDSPADKTYGLHYYGYGEEYLDILREETTV